PAHRSARGPPHPRFRRRTRLPPHRAPLLRPRSAPSPPRVPRPARPLRPRTRTSPPPDTRVGDWTGGGLDRMRGFLNFDFRFSISGIALACWNRPLPRRAGLASRKLTQRIAFTREDPDSAFRIEYSQVLHR